MPKRLFSAARCVSVAGFVAAAAMAAQPPAAPVYRDAVLVDFATESTGQLCGSTALTSQVPSGPTPYATTRGESCGETHIRVYTLQVGDATFVVKPVARGASQVRRTALAIGTLGYGNRLVKPQDVMKDTSPGSHLMVLQDASGFTVKVGDKLSYYATLGGR